MIPMGLNFGMIEVYNQYEHVGIDGRHYLVIHGDLFDGITRLAPWISFLGDQAYDILLRLNTQYNWLRRKLGFGYWSLSLYLKQRVKRAVDFVFKFESNLAGYCRKKGYDGIICGHIHKAEIKNIDGIVYMNDGDWQESCTALVEHWDGTWEIITWTQENDDVSADIISLEHKQSARHSRKSRVDSAQFGNLSTGT
jgi:UDP-2,3-diacylglucosamine pyrophosphatase LpxH